MIDAFWYDKPVDAKLRTAALKALRTPTVCQTLRNVCLGCFSFWTRLRAHARAENRADTVQNLKNLNFFLHICVLHRTGTQKNLRKLKIFCIQIQACCIKTQTNQPFLPIYEHSADYVFSGFFRQKEQYGGKQNEWVKTKLDDANRELVKRTAAATIPPAFRGQLERPTAYSATAMKTVQI